MVPPALTYRARLRVEGSALALCGVAGSVVLLLADDRTTQNAGSTLGQLALVAVLLGVLGPLSVRRAIASSRPAATGTSSQHKAIGGTRPVATGATTGEPTPLWHLPLVVTALALPLVLLGAWDAGLQVTAGCTLVGLAQALVLERVVRADERRTGRVFARAAGSRILRGTTLLHAPAA